MTWAETFERIAEHYARLAMTPGWWQYARQRVAAMEGHGSGLWRGLSEAVRGRIVQAGYRPHRAEIHEWHEPATKPSASPRGRGE